MTNKEINKIKGEVVERATQQTSEQDTQTDRPTLAVAPEGEGSDDGGISYTPTFSPGEIVDQPIVQEMKSNYLDYSMSVIVARALPESKDGLKPSQRRILVAMNDLGLYPNAHYRKSAKIAGDTSGNYHPHGEAIVYPTMVKLGQDFATRYVLVDKQGNFGSLDGDPPAAMRYTEAKMAKITLEMLRDLDKGTVTFIPNYDGTRLEPTVLPTLFPNLICNGTDGIAVGMATKIPPHNLTEVVSALRAMIRKGNEWQGKPIYNKLRLSREKGERIPLTLNSTPQSYLENYISTNDPEYEVKAAELNHKLRESAKLEVPETLYPEFVSNITPDELIDHIPGPDFPTGGTIFDQKEILNAYATGRGRILMRAKAKIEEGRGGRMQILVTEIPYQVNKSVLITKIADLVKDKKIIGIADLRDESNSREGIRIVVILKKDAQPKTVLNKLYKYTQMQMAFNANMIALLDQEPLMMPLKKMLEVFLTFRQVVTIRRYEFDLAQARYRGHILEGLLKALDALDEIIATIRASKTQEDAKSNLITKFDFTEVQAQAILDMQLRKLAALEREKLQEEFKEISAKITQYNRVLSDPAEVLKIVDQELAALAEKHGDERRTKVVKGRVGEFSEEDLVPSEDTFITISHDGYIKRVKPDTYRTQKRGGKGVVGATTKEDDYMLHALFCNTHDDLLLFTNTGRIFRTKVYEIPEYSRTAKGLPLVNLVQLTQDELVTSVLKQSKEGIMGEDETQEGQEESGVTKERNFKYLFMATKFGTVKKTDISEYESIRANGLITIKLDQGDELKWVRPTTGSSEVIMVTREGKAIRFNEKDVRALGRATRGVRGMKMKSGDDYLVSMDVIRSNEDRLFTLSELGYGKMTQLSKFAVQGRGGSGVFAFKVREKTGKVAISRVMDHPDREIVIISKRG